jgi:hypothetical protein
MYDDDDFTYIGVETECLICKKLYDPYATEIGISNCFKYCSKRCDELSAFE